MWKPSNEMSKEDVIVIATDGMWDVVTNKVSRSCKGQSSVQSNGDTVVTR